MTSLPVAAQNGNRVLVLGADLTVIEPAVSLLERWGIAPLVLFDVPSAMNALVRARPYLVVLDASFGSDLSGLLSVLQGDRALPPDARRAIPTLLLTGPDTPPLASIAGAGLSPDVMRGIRTVPAGQPLAVETALREALQIAGLSSYAPLAFSPPSPAPAPAPSRPALPVPVPLPAPTPTSRPPDRRLAPLLFALALLALLAVPVMLLFTRLSGSRPTAQPAQTARPPAPTAAPGASPTAAAAPLDPLLDPLRNLLGPLLGQPPASISPAAPAPPAQAGAPSTTGSLGTAGTAGTTGITSGPGGPGAVGPSSVPGLRPPWQPPTAPRLPFCGAVEQWRPLVRDTLAEAWNEARLDAPASALDDDLVLALILRESTGDPRAVNTGGAEEIGLLQLLPTTFAEQLARPGAESSAALTQAMQDPRSNLRAGVRYLARAFISQGGDLYWSLVAYRAGIEGAATWRRAGGTPAEIDARIRATLETYARHRPDVRLVFVPSPGAPAPATVRPVLPTGTC